ncbi:MAG TPA: glutathione S-transferase [Kofleriaceae bacterium]|jgi:glutathione S-transferase|nr:glutathione S-transferase [Kofleriaceae bacterium]
MTETVTYELYYWPSIPGRGEYVRLALEDAGARYVDVAREPHGMAAMQKMLRGDGARPRPFAPPFLKAGDLVIAQTAAILHWLAPRLGLVGASDADRLAAHQLQLTIADLVAEAHDVHHPIASSLYYDDQKPEAARTAEHFIKDRIPKYMTYFEDVLVHSGGDHLVGKTTSYVDLSLMNTLDGLRYAFPHAMARFEPRIPRTVALAAAVAARPRLAAYLASPRRLPFDQHGIFRHYPELDPP